MKVFYLVLVLGLASFLALCTIEEEEIPVEEEKVNDFELVEYAFKQGSLYDNREDYLELHFNKAILTVHSILLVKSNYCFQSFNFQIFNNGKSLRFPLTCVGLLDAIEVEVEIIDFDYNSLVVTIPVSIYKDKIEYKGGYRSLVMDKDTEFFWLLTEYPNRIYKIDHNTRQIIQQKELDFIPKSLHQSPHNGLIYVTGIDLPVIFIYDPSDLTLLREVHILPEESPYDHPQFPTIIPTNIAITRTGKGLVLFESVHSSSTKIRIIDANKNHEIRRIFHEDPQQGYNDQYQNLAGELKLTLNADNILIIPHKYIINPWIIFNPESEFGTAFSLPEGIGVNYKKAIHQETGWFYYYYNEEHYLWDWNQFRKIPVEGETVGWLSADFSYQEGENSTLYFLLQNRLEKINLETGHRKAASIRAYQTSLRIIPQTGDLLFISSSSCVNNETGTCTLLTWLDGGYFDTF